MTNGETFSMIPTVNSIFVQEFDLTFVFVILDDVEGFYELLQNRDIKQRFENKTPPLHYSIEFGKLHSQNDQAQNIKQNKLKQLIDLIAYLQEQRKFSTI